MADLDTRSKRASSVQLLVPSMLAPVLPDGTIATADRIHGAWMYAGIAPSVAVEPEDADDDIAYTARLTVADGATIRPPRPWLRHAANSLRNADLEAAERLAADEYFAVGIRTGRGDTAGYGHRFIIEGCGRAGHGGGLAFLEVEYADNSDEGARPHAADTTNRTSTADAATLSVPTFHVKHAADSLRNSSLRASSEDRDATLTIHWTDPSVRTTGIGHRVVLEGEGRAGNCGALLLMEVEYSITADDFMRIVAEDR